MTTKFLRQNRVPFCKLTEESKLALLEYCQMSCRTMQEAEQFYKDSLFTVEIITAEEAKKKCMEESDLHFETFEEYHKCYCGDGSNIPNHGESIWPVINGLGDGVDWLDDGWHRFHSYIKHGVKEFPLLRIEHK